MMTTVKAEAVQGSMHALDETTSTSVLRLAGREGRRSCGWQVGKDGGREGRQKEEEISMRLCSRHPSSLRPSLSRRRRDPVLLPLLCQRRCSCSDRKWWRALTSFF